MDSQERNDRMNGKTKETYINNFGYIIDIGCPHLKIVMILYVHV